MEGVDTGNVFPIFLRYRGDGKVIESAEIMEYNWNNY